MGLGNAHGKAEAAPPNRLAEDQSLTRALTASSDIICNSEPEVKKSKRGGFAVLLDLCVCDLYT